ncbi:DUF6346 domain-containing protein [Actinoplanes sp. L3-i22]|uniref:DUF6346 domain-containing protein n=1 Tax=Actinoplanes sp. L3-i22 TaxID=2836373 RepID=UPI001C767367|nr:DUF6346 domain-containing protein [Actinoplanes sp. L3-i22]BCY05370.1 hypothetical protein L3i22_004580 [Actinoplanes sp. L3-i22]
MTDENRAAYRKRRMAEMLAEAEAGVARSRAAKQRAAEIGPVIESRRGGWFRNVLGLLIILAVSFVLLATSMTVARFTGADFADARRTGEAKIVSCERRGPVSLKGFGYYKACSVSISWSGRARVTIDKPGFFTDEKPGDTFTIGENTGSRGRIGYSRAELPSRGWVTFIAAVIGFLGVVPILLLLAMLRDGLRGLFRRRRE